MILKALEKSRSNFLNSNILWFGYCVSNFLNSNISQSGYYTRVESNGESLYINLLSCEKSNLSPENGSTAEDVKQINVRFRTRSIREETIMKRVSVIMNALFGWKFVDLRLLDVAILLALKNHGLVKAPL